MSVETWVNIVSGNGLFPDGTKPLPEPMLPYGDLYLSFDNNTNGIAHQSSHYSWTRLKITATSPKKQWVKWSSIQVDFFQSIWLVVRFLWCNDCHFAWFWWCLCLRRPSKSLLCDNRSKPLWLVRDMTRSLHSQFYENLEAHSLEIPLKSKKYTFSSDLFLKLPSWNSPALDTTLSSNFMEIRWKFP